MSVDDWASMMVLAQKGDAETYKLLLTDISIKMRPFVAQRVHPDAVDDLIQEILLRVHAYRDSYSSDRPMKPWINSIARNAIIDHAEKRKKMVVIDSGIEVEAIESHAYGETTQLDDRIDAILRGMPEDQRLAFQLTKIQGLSLEEGAAIAGISLSAFKSRAARAVQSFKKILEEQE